VAGRFPTSRQSANVTGNRPSAKCSHHNWAGPPHLGSFLGPPGQVRVVELPHLLHAVHATWEFLKLGPLVVNHAHAAVDLDRLSGTSRKSGYRFKICTRALRIVPAPLRKSVPPSENLYSRPATARVMHHCIRGYADVCRCEPMPFAFERPCRESLSHSAAQAAEWRISTRGATLATMLELFPRGFRVERRPANGVVLNVCYDATPAPARPPLLLLHGFPQTHAIWHRVAERLRRSFTLVMPDLRGYGDSDKPDGPPDHSALLDIAPTLTMYEHTTMEFARSYYHWFFLIQPAPLPETLIGAAPAFYLRSKLGGWGSEGLSLFDERALAEYERCFAIREAVHAMCEDYRAAATIDLDHDRADAARRIDCRTHVLWGERGVVHRLFTPLEDWQAKCAHDVTGRVLPTGHYIPEEAPDLLAAELEAFFA
jgi:haloacetate dehalogenase